MAHGATLFQLGMDLGCEPRKAQEEVSSSGTSNVAAGPWQEQGAQEQRSADDRKDHFILRDGRYFAGTHLIIDLWGAERIDDLDHVEKTLIEAVEEAGATLLHIHLHHFTPNGGVSGVAVLAESHISIHTWPERGYAALDVFMCGDSVPHRAIPVLRRAFEPKSVNVGEFYRGETV